MINRITAGFVTLLLMLSSVGCTDSETELEVSAAGELPGDAAMSFSVSLDADDRAKLGIGVAALQAAEYQDRIEGQGAVIGLEAIVPLVADLTAASAAARASSAALERARGLFGAGASVSRESLESAEERAAAADAQLRNARARAISAFGADAPWLDAGGNDALLAKLTRGTTVLVAASFPAGLPGRALGPVTVRRIGLPLGTDIWTAASYWRGPSDPAIPGPSLFALIDNGSDEAGLALAYGERVIAAVATGEPRAGVVVPASAVVLFGGEAWCYVLTEEGTFVRVAIGLERPLRGGYLQFDGFEAGQEAVVEGAGLLLGLETGGGEAED
jgi:hypothetical protein